MIDPIIICPNCKAEIKLTESLAAPLIEATRKKYEEQLSEKDNNIAIREQTMREKEKQLSDEKNKFHEQVAKEVEEQLKIDRSRITSEETKKAQQIVAIELAQKSQELADLQEVLKSREGKLIEAQKSQTELIKKQRVLDEEKRELELTIEKKVQESLVATYEKGKNEAIEQQKLRLMEREQTISAMQKQIEDLKRRSEQVSPQLQGSVQELDLENLLRNAFHLDSIEPVPKGECGGDIIHRVISNDGKSAGIILWECKRTKNWSDTWLPKLREDQRNAKAEIAVIVSLVLPKNIENFGSFEGIWIAHPNVAIPLAMVLRNSLIEVSSARLMSQGQQTKTEMIYQYLTGPQFRQRVEAIVEAFSIMKEDLEKERKVIMKQWAKREAQITHVTEATVGMYGDLQGIAGKTLPQIDGLELKSLASQNDLKSDSE